VIQDDALILSKLGDAKFDLIVTDPPYYDDVPYTELSDFYYVWLKRALSDNDGYSLTPRFHKEAFFDEWGNEIETQWSTFARNEITLDIDRYKYLSIVKEDKEAKSKGKELYAEMLARSFETMASKLKDNGLLITYFAHSDPDAWKALIYAGWKKAGLLVSAAYPLITESEESVVSRGKAAITASIVVVWRKRRKENPEDILDLAEARESLVDLLSKEFRKLIRMGLHGVTLYVMLYAKALSEMTRYSRIVDGARELSVDDMVLEASKLVAKAIVKGANPEIVTPEATFYLLFKLVGVRPEKKSRKKLPSSDLILVGYGTLSLDKAERIKLVAPAKSKSSEEEEEEEFEVGASVAKRKVYNLIEPLDDSEDAILKVLGLKDVDPGKPETMKTSVDVLHVLELYADRGAEEVKRKYAELSQALGWKAKEAIELAKSLVYLEKWKDPEKRDPEAARCERLLNQLGISVEEGD
jgi:putative DNA methylase